MRRWLNVCPESPVPIEPKLKSDEDEELDPKPDEDVQHTDDDQLDDEEEPDLELAGHPKPTIRPSF